MENFGQIIAKLLPSLLKSQEQPAQITQQPSVIGGRDPSMGMAIANLLKNQRS